MSDPAVVAAAKELRSESSALELVLVNVRAKDKPTKWDNLGRKKKLKVDFHTVEVAALADEPHRAEPTFRSRPFLYDLLAGYGASIIV